jgi:hypothetical protein
MAHRDTVVSAFIWSIEHPETDESAEMKDIVVDSKVMDTLCRSLGNIGDSIPMIGIMSACSLFGWDYRLADIMRNEPWLVPFFQTYYGEPMNTLRFLHDYSRDRDAYYSWMHLDYEDPDEMPFGFDTYYDVSKWAYQRFGSFKNAMVIMNLVRYWVVKSGDESLMAFLDTILKLPVQASYDQIAVGILGSFYYVIHTNGDPKESSRDMQPYGQSLLKKLFPIGFWDVKVMRALSREPVDVVMHKAIMGDYIMDKQ